jgi:hypothetical protein
MAHFAKVQKGVVVNVIIAEPDFFDTFVDSSAGEWIQTSYNTRGGVHYGPDGEPDGGVALRKNYAGVGMLYDIGRDAFYTVKPFPSWVLNDATCLWEAPLTKPDGFYEWHEDAYQADNTTGWVVVEEGE